MDFQANGFHIGALPLAFEEVVKMAHTVVLEAERQSLSSTTPKIL